MELDWKSIIFFLHTEGKNATEIYQEIYAWFPSECPSYSSITWFLRKEKWTVTSKPSTISEKSQHMEEEMNQISDILKDYPYASVRQIERLTGIPKSTVFNILTNSLKYTSRHLKWVPHLLNSEQKKNRVDLSKRLLKSVTKARSYSYDIFLTGDESWFYLETDYEIIWLPENKKVPEKEKKMICDKNDADNFLEPRGLSYC